MKIIGVIAWIVLALALSYLVTCVGVPIADSEPLPKEDAQIEVMRKELMRQYREQITKICRETGIYKQYRCI
jgi:hypothetical protein